MTFFLPMQSKFVDRNISGALKSCKLVDGLAVMPVQGQTIDKVTSSEDRLLKPRVSDGLFYVCLCYVC